MYDIGDNDKELKEAASAISKGVQQCVQKIQNLAEKLAKIIESIISAISKIKETGRVDPQDMQFTGKVTDIVGLDGMKCADVKNYMPNEAVYESTKKNIMSLQKNGYISIDEYKVIHITDKGRELIQGEQFMKQFEQDQFDAKFEDIRSQNPDEQIAYCEFNGSEQDMGVFNYTEQVDLNSIQDCQGKKTVVNNFTSLKNQGMVNINNGVVTPTEKGLDFAKSLSFSVKPASRDEIQSVFSSVGKNAEEKSGASKAGGQVANAAAKSGAQTAKTAAKAGGNAATNTAAKAVTGATKKIASEAVKGIAKGAAGVATGVATAGVGAIVAVAVEVLMRIIQAKKALKPSVGGSANQTMKK